MTAGSCRWRRGPREILDGMAGICELLDQGDAGEARIQPRCARSRKSLADVERTPSARCCAN